MPDSHLQFGRGLLCESGFGALSPSVLSPCACGQIWGSPTPNEIVADEEAVMVAYCTTDKYGTRVLPQGTIQGIQLYVLTPTYCFIDS